MSFPIEKASREGAKVVIGVIGPSGSGKTYTALMLAYGLSGRKSEKVGFLDTENRRGRLYADVLPNKEQFMIADFPPPFSPERYIQAIRDFEAAGITTLVIDSISHSWEGTGGCEEIATAGDPRVPRWNKAKLENKRMVNAMLQSSMDLIVCVRAREKVDMSNPREIKQLGMMPICEKNLPFEFTASVMMLDEGKRQNVLKCPEALRNIMGRGNDYLTIEDGQALRQWIDGGTPVDHEAEQARASLATAAESGLNALGEAWSKLTKKMQTTLKDEKDQYKEAAIAYDKHREQTTPTTEGAGA